MPEIAEVRTVARTLKEKIVGKKINKIDFIYDKIINEDLNCFSEHVLNKTIEDIKTVGKYLIFNLGEYSLVSHLRMEGKYFIKPINEEIVKHEHIIFYLDDISLRYHDTRKFGRMFTCLTSEVMKTKELSKLGYEPNDDKLTENYLYNKIHKKNIAIKTLLLDQTIINGLGNIYVDEVLFASNINPSRLGSKITKNECNQIIKNSKEITDLATNLGGTTIRSYTSSLGVYGSYQEHLKVHTKVNQKCQVCGTTILKTRVGGRGTYYCPKCQKY